MCMQLVRSAEERDKIRASIRVHLKAFRNPTTPTEIIDTEFFNLEKYLTYRVSLSDYEEARIRALKELEVLKRTHVEDVLRKYDEEERRIWEQENWGWSSLYLIFKRWPLTHGPVAPWSHTDSEWH